MITTIDAQASKWEWRSYSIIIIICLLSLSPYAFWSFIISITICFNSTLVWFVISSKLEAQSLTKLCEIIHLNGMFSLSVEYRNAKIHASSFARLVIISCDFLLIFIKINFRTFHLHKTTNAVFFFHIMPDSKLVAFFFLIYFALKQLLNCIKFKILYMYCFSSITL